MSWKLSSNDEATFHTRWLASLDKTNLEVRTCWEMTWFYESEWRLSVLFYHSRHTSIRSIQKVQFQSIYFWLRLKFKTLWWWVPQSWLFFKISTRFFRLKENLDSVSCKICHFRECIVHMYFSIPQSISQLVLNFKLLVWVPKPPCVLVRFQCDCSAQQKQMR